MSKPKLASVPSTPQAQAPEHLNVRTTLVDLELLERASLFEVVEAGAKLTRLAVLVLYGLQWVERNVGADDGSDLRLLQEVTAAADLFAARAEALAAKAAGIEGVDSRRSWPTPKEVSR